MYNVSLVKTKNLVNKIKKIIVPIIFCNNNRYVAYIGRGVRDEVYIIA